MKTLITNAYVLDMVGDTPNIEKKDILIDNNKIEKIEKDIDKEQCISCGTCAGICPVEAPVED